LHKNIDFDRKYAQKPQRQHLAGRRRASDVKSLSRQNIERLFERSAFIASKMLAFHRAAILRSFCAKP
jgi:hypothetical protein